MHTKARVTRRRLKSDRRREMDLIVLLSSAFGYEVRIVVHGLVVVMRRLL